MRQTLRDQAAAPLSRVETAQAAAPSTDRRTLRTRRALRDALAAEIERTGDLSQVTVTGVADAAGVTRRTFYSHFRDIPDLVGAIEAQTVGDLRPLVARIAQVRLADLERAIRHVEPCPGAKEVLDYFKRRPYLAPLLGEGGDPAFSGQVKSMVHEVVRDRALNGLDLRAIPFFDYYLTFAISAEVGVLVRWLQNGMREPTAVMARVMTMLMFVRPGDLYGKSLDFDVNALGQQLLADKETR